MPGTNETLVVGWSDRHQETTAQLELGPPAATRTTSNGDCSDHSNVPSPPRLVAKLVKAPTRSINQGRALDL